MDDLIALADRCEAGIETDDELCAVLLGWHQRRVTRLGLNGRTPGSFRWFPPDAEWGDKGRAKPPRLTGPRMRLKTAAALRDLSPPSDKEQ